MRISAQSSDGAVLEELGSRLRGARLERNLSQEALAEQAGLGRMTLHRIERGESTSVANLIRILRALDLLDSLETLLPAGVPSPLDQVHLQGRGRKRAGAPRPEPSAAPWRWGDEEGEEP